MHQHCLTDIPKLETFVESADGMSIGNKRQLILFDVTGLPIENVPRELATCFRPCQIRILLSVNSSLTNLGTFSPKHTNRKRKTQLFYENNSRILYHNMRQWSDLLMK